MTHYQYDMLEHTHVPILRFIFMVWNIIGAARAGTGFVIFYLYVIFNPLLGLTNALVYYWPRYKSHKQQNPGQSRTKCICHDFHISIPRRRIQMCCARDLNQSVEAALVSPLIDEHAREEYDDRI